MVIVLMGVSGSGKTTIGLHLAAELAWRFADGDDFHSPGNIQKMASGQALTDADRLPWLSALSAEIRDSAAAGQSLVLACSALKRSYRQRLAVAGVDVRFVYLKGTAAVLGERLRNRTGHFMKDHLLASQFAALEEPSAGEATLIDAELPPGRIVEQIRAELGVN
jgi:gluconokinase